MLAPPSFIVNLVKLPPKLT